MAELIDDGDVVRSGFIGVGQQDVVGHDFHRVQSKLKPLIPDLLCVPQVLLRTGQVGESGEFPGERTSVNQETRKSL